MCRVAGVARVLLLVGFANLVLGSAIPMWEFLSRTEKMNLLYSMFVKQVNEYCDTVGMPDRPDCQKGLLLYGLTNLAKMGEDSLDKMDPYQRGASVIVWESMMKGSFKPMETSSQNHKISSTEGENETGSGDNNLGSQVEASSNIPHYATTDSQKYISGPMIVRVLPNGRPVPGESHLPALKDEDAEDFKLMSSHPPSEIMQLATGANTQQFAHKVASFDAMSHVHKLATSP
ncbi:Rhythmically expressed gene 5 protein [Gryllus bimaculatus]|nr:Rhythmically expressed gene 5 protein [Gryllus bimaculatus]